MNRPFWRNLAGSLVFVLAADLSAGTLTGDVKTPDGTALPQVDLVLAGPDGARSLVTGLGGRFDAGDVKPGDYRIETATPGFVTLSPQTIRVGSGSEHVSILVGPAGLKEHIVVAATRSDAVASTLGVPTTVLDGDDIEARHPLTLLHLFQEVPGITASQAGGPGRQASLFVRGGESNFSRLMVDGVVVNSPGGAFDYGDLLALDVSRIEVVRGAGSSLYGTDALAGVINIVTREPGPRSLTAEAEGGSFGFWQGRAGASGRSGAFDWRAALLHLRTDSEEPNSAFKETAGVGSFAWHASDSAALRGTFRATDSRVGTPGQTLYGRPDLDAHAKRSDFTGGLSFEARGERVVHTVRLGIADTDQISVNPLDSGPYVPTFGDLQVPFTVFDFVDPIGFQNNTRRSSLGYQAEIQAGSTHLFTMGAEAERETGELGTRNDPFASIDPKRTNVGVYAQDRVGLGGRAFLTFGARLEQNDSYGTKFVPRAAVAYRLSGGANATTLHASAGTGVNEPNFFHTYGLPPFTRPNPDLKPERSRTFDLGIEQRISSNTRLDVTAFHHAYRDQIAFRTVDFVTFEGAYFNIAKTRAQGIETSIEVATSRGLTLRGAYTLLAGRIIDPNGSFDPVYAKDNSLLRRPKHQGSLAVRYARARLDAGANLVTVGRRADSDFWGLGLESNDGYTRVDARLSVSIRGGLRAFGVVENAFDKTYQEVLGYPALGRSVRVGLSLRGGENR